MAITPRRDTEKSPVDAHTPTTGVTGTGADADPSYSTDAAHPATTDSAATHPAKKIERTRAATTYTGLVIGAIILVVLLVFIVQNLDTAPIKIFAWTLDLPLGVSILLAAILGALIMALAGGVRILQIRRAATRQ